MCAFNTNRPRFNQVRLKLIHSGIPTIPHITVIVVICAMYTTFSIQKNAERESKNLQ